MKTKIIKLTINNGGYYKGEKDSNDPELAALDDSGPCDVEWMIAIDIDADGEISLRTDDQSSLQGRLELVLNKANANVYADEVHGATLEVYEP